MSIFSHANLFHQPVPHEPCQAISISSYNTRCLPCNELYLSFLLFAFLFGHYLTPLWILMSNYFGVHASFLYIRRPSW